MRSISRYFFSTLLILSFSVSGLKAQKEETAPIPTKQDTIKLYNGFLIGTDLLNPIEGAFGSAYSSYELDLETGLSGRYFPVLELGMSKANKTDDYGSTFKYNPSPYGRIGINCAISRSVGSSFYTGLRIGYSKFNYSVDNMTITNSYWDETMTTSISNQKSYAVWTELVGGLRVKMNKHLYMGWSVRIKFRNKVKNTDESQPAYIPGYGKNASNTYGIQYTVYYKF